MIRVVRGLDVMLEQLAQPGVRRLRDVAGGHVHVVPCSLAREEFGKSERDDLALAAVTVKDR